VTDADGKKYTYAIDCIHRQWIGKPDPAGFGRYTFHTNDPEAYRARLAKHPRLGKILRVRKINPC
jgi:hypothetical protein